MRKADIIRGALIYSSGDSVAAFLLDQFSWQRLLGMVVLGGLLYAWEITRYFAWIERQTQKLHGFKKSLSKTALALLYFNPLWIARHLLFIKLFSREFSAINEKLLYTGSLSFLFNIPLAILANYLIQNIIPLRWRFTASAIFSALMAVYYAASERLFS